ncbi:amino acid adenylation domain-containing protein [Arhodomonas sp. AD133]|uniref:amino acid adenylation domain-containing protein n=1 Tax=Arhodomonas sp. AD133 TaxID=3415009 RepID=UPI003EBC289B
MAADTVARRLASVAASHSERTALRFVGTDGREVVNWRYADLYDRVQRLAARIAVHHAPGERALLLTPSGADMALGLLAAIHAGVIAVPVNLPGPARVRRVIEQLEHVMGDAEPTLVLTTGEVQERAGGEPLIAALDVQRVDDVPEKESPMPPCDCPEDAIAFLQYSSGSTGRPKGVCNTHRNLLAQVALFHRIWDASDPIHMATWLPLYHDMGVVLGLLVPLLTGGTCTLLSPQSFASEPLRWLRAASDYRANWLVAPDFAYRLCSDVVPAEAVEDLDLTAVRYAVNGAEPVRPETLERFCRHFAAAGFAAQAMTPGYGLAEAGLCVSISHRPRGWRIGCYDVEAMACGTAAPCADGSGRTLVSCGDYFDRWELAIVRPEDAEELPERSVGEIWIKGESAASGYWRNEGDSQDVFGAHLCDGRGPFVRTGDLGFLDGGELFVCGRLKDLIVVNGANYHPNDLELTLEREVEGIRVGGACAVQQGDDGALVLMAEMNRHAAREKLAEAVDVMARAVYVEHGLVADRIALIPRGSLLKTSSGKIRRQEMARRYHESELRLLYRRERDSLSDATPSERSDDALLTRLHDSLCEMLGLGGVGVDEGFADLGLDSLRATRWCALLGQRFGIGLVPGTVFRYPSLRRLSAALQGQSNDAEALRERGVSIQEPVAIIGVGLRLPGAPAEFGGFSQWLLSADSATGPVPEARKRDGVPLTQPGGYLDSVDGFDAGFFGLSANEAEATDPQQRILLETVWHAIEHAGLPAERLAGEPVGVFLGQGHNDYAMMPLRAGRTDCVRGYYAQGASMSSSAGRVAYHLNLVGPAMVIDTACSASLAALDTAMRYLDDGECDLALAGGVNILLSPETENALTVAGMLSPRGRCATLSADADGYARGEGAAVFVLKPLTNARRDGDRILGVVRGSALQQDGASGGLTVPNADAQARLIRRVLGRAGLSPDAVDAVEMHGTGTPLGDPLEFSALETVFGDRSRPMLLGSVKTNVGHLEAAAGAAGLARALAALHTGRWPGSPTFTELNPEIRTGRSTFELPRDTRTLEPAGRVARIGVSSFGFNGTIGHVLVEGAPHADGSVPTAPWKGWVPLAAADEQALQQMAMALARCLFEASPDERADILAAWRQQRTHRLSWRALVCADDAETLIGRLERPHAAYALEPGRITLRLPDANAAAALLDGLQSWLPEAVSQPGESTVSALVALLGMLGLRPDSVVGEADDTGDAVTDSGVLLRLTSAQGTERSVVLDPSDGGRSGLFEAWQLGAPLDWGVVDGIRAPVMSLPLYPFQRRRYWYPVDAPTDFDTPSADNSEQGSWDLERLRREVAELLEIEPRSIGDEDDLIGLGLDSLMAMDLVSKLKSDGIAVTFDALFETPTVNAWSRLLSEGGAADTAPFLPATVVDDAAPFALTSVQHAYWIGRDEAQPLGGVGCHVYAEFDGAGLEPARLERAVSALIARHGMLRARFLADGRQRIDEQGAWPGLTVHDLTGADAGALEERLTALREVLSHRKLAVADGEVFDIQLSLLPKGRSRLHFNIDMLVADAFSIRILLEELAELYRDSNARLPDIESEFPRYRAALEETGAAERERSQAYWQQRLPDLPPAPGLPMEADPSQLRQPRFRRRSHRLSPDRWVALQQRARSNGVTPSMMLAACYAEVLAAWSSNARFLLNLTLFNRRDLVPGVERLVADFTTLTLLDVDATESRTLAERAAALQRQFTEVVGHSAYSGVEVLRDLARLYPDRPMAAPVVFTSNLGRDLLGEDTEDCLGRVGWMISQTPQVWLDHQVMEYRGGLLLAWDAVEDLFPAGVLDAMFEAYCGLLERLADSESVWQEPVGDLRPADQRAVRERVNATAAPRSGALLHEGFFAQAARAPGRPALLGAGGELSYGELADWARRIAARLRARGLQPGETVAVTQARGSGQVAAVLGVLFAGGVYVPVAADQPLARRARIYADAGVKRVLSTAEQAVALEWPEGVEVLSVEAAREDEPLGEAVARAEQELAYVIYTSGSTGEPKGVMVSHAAAVNTVEAVNERYGVGEADRVLALSALHFDLSVYDLFGVLGAGGSVVLVSEQEYREPSAWLEYLRAGVTLWNSVPALLEMLLIHVEGRGEVLPQTLRQVLVSGDWVGLDLRERLRRCSPGAKLTALGGATEAAIWSNAFDVEEVPGHWRSIPYGYPLRNQCYRVVDERCRDCPDWVAGELWIGGAGVAQGYYGDAGRTAEQFVQSAGERWYRTGDLGRYWPDGTLEFLGRLDTQVKLRGHRIELGEVEAALRRHPAVQHAAAMVVGESERRIAAAVVVDDAAGDTVLTAQHELSNATAETLDDTPVLELPDRDGYERAEAELAETLMLRLLNESIDFDAGACAVADMERQLGLASGMRALLHRWLHWLASRDVLGETETGFVPAERFAAVAACADPMATVARSGAEMLVPVAERLTERLGDIAAMLRGEQDPVGLLDDSVLAPEVLVGVQPAQRVALDRLAGWLVQIAERLGRPPRVAELGAGSGLTAERLLAELGPAWMAYTLLERSQAQLRAAATRLADDADALRFERLPAEGVPEPLRHGFDIVLANNALHRYPQLDTALNQASALLAPGGLLLALETAELSPLALLTVALVERGFTGLADSRRDAGTPLLPPQAWCERFTGYGLEAAGASRIVEGTPVWLLHARQLESLCHCPTATLGDWLAGQLPDYMLPETLLRLRRLPLTANGKIDRASLERQVETLVFDASAALSPPQGELENRVAELWRELMGVDDVGRESGFFHLGGDSLIATRLMARLEAVGVHGGELAALFANPVLRDFAATLCLGEPDESGPELETDPDGRHRPFPLTDVQQAYWFGRREDFVLGGVGTHFYTEFDGAHVDLPRLEAAWNRLIRRHEMLRAVFDDDGRQRILAEVPLFRIRVVDADGDDGASELREAMSHQVLDPRRWPVFDVRAVRYGDRTRLGVSLDNIVLDGLSMQILFTELARLYEDPSAELPPVDVSFRDYVLSVGSGTETEVASAEAYWRERLYQLPPAPRLPLARDPAQIRRPRFVRRQAQLDVGRWQRLKALARSYDLTPSTLLLACYGEVLSAWSARAELTINLTLFDRREVHPDINHILGDFTSLLLISFRPEIGESWLTGAQRLQAQLWRDLAHRQVSAVWVMRELARVSGTDDAAMPVVFTSALGVDDAVSEFAARDFPERVWGVSQTPQVWLDHQVFEQQGQLHFNWDAVEDLFPAGVLDAMFEAYCGLLERLADSESVWKEPVGDLRPADQRAVRERVNATAALRSGALLHEGFFAQAARAPGRPALLGAGGELSYGELADWARRIAARLRARGLQPGETVAVTQARGSGQVAAVLGVLFAGGVYVPVAADQPLARRARIYADAGVKRVLSTAEQAVALEWPEGVEVLSVEAAREDEPLGEAVARAEQELAYVIYTSGSTGEPKGVMVSHAAAVNTVEAVNERYGVGEADRVLALSALHFDLSVYDLFGVLGAGGSVVLVSEQEYREPSAWLEYLRAGVTLWNSVPALLEMLLIHVEGRGEVLPQTLRQVLVSGDWVGLDLRERLRRCSPGAKLTALGGATEAAIWSNAFDVEEVPGHWRSIPYGYPLRNQCYRVVDERCRDCPDWVAGELWIGGAGVAQGYYGDAGRTAEQFVQSAGERWYRTGDLGRYWPDGTLEFLGRLDTQVKLRGHRIELGEVEAALRRHPAVQQAVVIAVGEGVHRRLHAHVTPDMASSESELIAFATGQLPEYAVPEHCSAHAQLPLTANGKVDRNALAEHSAQAVADAVAAVPEGDTERSLARIWEALLERTGIGREESFFALGGDSLLATRLVEAVYREFGVELSLGRLFEAATVAALAAEIERLEDEQGSQILEEGAI